MESIIAGYRVKWNLFIFSELFYISLQSKKTAPLKKDSKN